MAGQNGVYPRPATAAEGYAKLTGTPGAIVPPYFEVTTDIGIFVSVGTIPLSIPQSGEIIVSVRAMVPGSEMNAAGTILTGTLTTSFSGINSEVIICGGMFCGGQDEETCEEFRQRYLKRLTYKPKATMAWIQEKLLEFPCATRVCVREGACCRCEPECTDCGCKNCGNRMEFYVFFDDTFPCGIPPANIVEDINIWLFGEHQGYGEGQVEIGICGQIYAPVPIMINVHIDIAGCPTTSQKQIIEDQIRALFKRVCPSKPMTNKQLELIVASVVGTDVNSAVYMTIDGYEDQVPPYPRDKVYLDHCGIEPECDIMPCLNEVTFTGPDQSSKPC
jgi:uncharacterized phage protein gp47/JayE